MTQETAAQAPPPPATVIPTVNATSDGFRVAIYAPRGPRMYLGPRALLFTGQVVFTCEPSPLLAKEFASIDIAEDAAVEVLGTFEWNTPAARDRIVEIIDASGAMVGKTIIAANGITGLRLVH